MIKLDQQSAIAVQSTCNACRRSFVRNRPPLAGKPFYAGEEYHQDYLTLHPYQPYIVYNDAPKIEALKKIFADNYRDKPVLVRDTKATN